MAKTKTTKTKKTSSKTKETKLKAKQLQNSVESSIELSKKQYSLSSSKVKSIEYGKVPEVKKANLPQEEIDSINNELASFYEQLNEKQSKLDKLTFKEQKLLAKQKVEKAKLKYGETKAQLVSEIKLLNNSISKLQKRIYPDGLSKTDYALIVKNFNAFYGSKQALFDVNIYFPKNTITALIGPSGCGKSTFLRSLNRINDEIPAFNATGTILFNDSIDIYKLMDLNNPSKKINISEIRTRIGMIFQQPNPFPMSIYKNVTYGPKINGVTNKAILNKIAQDSLKSAAIWEETKDILNSSAMGLSGGQQQRLCIARAIANQSEILLMDEPTSALDPIASAKIEELILELKKEYTIIFVTHSMQQAARISDFTGFFHEGKLIEIGPTQKIFTSPNEQKTDDYIRGRFG